MYKISLFIIVLLLSPIDSVHSQNNKTIANANLGSQPRTLDPALVAAVDGANVLVNIYEGLMRLDKNGQPSVI